jgi:hypothetical protein
MALVLNPLLNQYDYTQHVRPGPLISLGTNRRPPKARRAEIFIANRPKKESASARDVTQHNTHNPKRNTPAQSITLAKQINLCPSTSIAGNKDKTLGLDFQDLIEQTLTRIVLTKANGISVRQSLFFAANACSAGVCGMACLEERCPAQ